MPYTVQPSKLPGCSITNLQTNSTFVLPCYPDDITMSISANWNDSQAIGRSEPITAYTGTNFKEYSFNIALHRDFCEAKGLNFDTLQTVLMNTVYAQYGVDAAYHSPLTAFTFGKFHIEGAVTSLNVKYNKPINKNGDYMHAEISISIKSIPKELPSYNNFNKDWSVS